MCLKRMDGQAEAIRLYFVSRLSVWVFSVGVTVGVTVPLRRDRQVAAAIRHRGSVDGASARQSRYHGVVNFFSFRGSNGAR